MPRFLRTENGCNVYEFECSICGVFGEIGVPTKKTGQVIAHGCGMLYIQLTHSGLFSKPELIEINADTTAHA